MAKTMKLKSIEFSGYKSYGNRPKTKIEFKDINVIIGANGSGKSNLISFFDMMSFMMTGAFQDYVAKQDAQSLLYFGSKVTETIYAEIVFENDENIDIYEFKLLYSLSGKLVFGGEKLTWQAKNKHKKPKELIFKAGDLESVLSNKEQKEMMVTVIRTIFSNCKVFHFNDTSYSARMRQQTYINDNAYLKADAGNLAAFLYRLKEDKDFFKYYKLILKYVQEALPQLQDFVLVPDFRNNNNIKLNWKTRNSDELFGPHQLSDGSLRFIALATVLLQPPETRPAVIILDEPEIGLHPHAVSLLANMIKTVGTDKQIIISTQSSSLLDEFECDNIIVAEFDHKNNTSTLKRVSEELLRDWLSDYTLSDLWNKNIIGGLPL